MDDRKSEPTFCDALKWLCKQGAIYSAGRETVTGVALAELMVEELKLPHKVISMQPQAASAGALSAEELAHLSRGTFVCDICGKDVPHHHDAKLVEIERLIRPAFEKTCIARNAFGRINRHPSVPYTDEGTEQLWQHFINGWFASKRSRA